MTVRTIAVIAVILWAQTLCASDQSRSPAGKRSSRFSIVVTGKTTILLDTVSGRSWVFRRPTDGKPDAWISIERKDVADVPAVRQLPRLEMARLRPNYTGKVGQQKGERRRRPYERFPVIVPISPRDIGRYFYEPQAAEVIRRHYDPARQQLLMVWWWFWSTGNDKLAYRVEKNTIDFTLQRGKDSQQYGKGKPWGPSVRFFVVRDGLPWKIGQTTEPNSLKGEEQAPKKAVD